MDRVLWAGAGGFFGAALRYALGTTLARAKGGSTFPWETLVINVIGCLAIGVLGTLADSRGLITGTARVFIIAGILGGFTTYSAFGYETFQLLRNGHAAAAFGSIAMQLLLGLAAVWAGAAFARGAWN